MQLFWIHLEELSERQLFHQMLWYYGSYFTVVYVKWTEALITFVSLHLTVDIWKKKFMIERIES